MRPIFCGNFEFDTRQSELERLFRRYGKVDRVDIKSGFAFVYMDEERDAEDAIRGLDRLEFGRKGRRLRVEWSKEERGRRPEGSKKPSANSRPSKTLFVINFDPYDTRTKDLERHFDPYGKILNIRIRRNFAFIQYESQEDATRALDATNLSKLMDRVITVEYAVRDDDDKRNGHSPIATRDRSPRRGYGRARSRSPYGRERASPDYGHGRGRGLSPSPHRRGRPSPDYGRGRSPSPNRRERNPEYGRGPSPGVRKERNPGHGNGRSPSPRRERDGPENGEVTSPPGRRRSDFGDRTSASPDKKITSPSPLGRRRSDFGDRTSASPDKKRTSPSPQRERREKYSPDGYHRGSSPNSKHAPAESPVYGGGESPERYRSRSPPARERSRS